MVPSRAASGVASVAFDRAAEYYDRTRGYPTGVPEQIAELFCRAGGLGSSSTVLEVGIGTGRIALPLSERVRRVAGVDLAQPMLARLLEKRVAQPVFPVLGDACALPLRTGSVDVAVCVNVFHLVPNWLGALAELARVLVPGARLLTAADDMLLPELWQRVHSELPRVAHVGVASSERDFPLQAGFSLASEPFELRYMQRVVLAEFFRAIEERVWSSTWRMTDETHALLVDRMRSAIAEAYGSLETVLDVQRTFSVGVYEAPASNARP